MLAALLCSLVVALVATLGDFIWAAPHLSHRMWYGLAHGAGLCMAMGLVAGRAGPAARDWRRRRHRRRAAWAPRASICSRR